MHTIIKTAVVSVLALFAIVGVVSISKAEEILLKCSFEAGVLNVPDGIYYYPVQVGPRIYELMFNDQTNEIWLNGEKFLDTRVTEIIIYASLKADNGNMYFFRIDRRDGSAYHEFRSPVDGSTWSYQEQGGSCKKIDPTKKLF